MEGYIIRDKHGRYLTKSLYWVELRKMTHAHVHFKSIVDKDRCKLAHINFIEEGVEIITAIYESNPDDTWDIGTTTIVGIPVPFPD